MLNLGTCHNESCPFKGFEHEFDAIDDSVTPVLAQICKICGCTASLHDKVTVPQQEPQRTSNRPASSIFQEAATRRKQRANKATINGVKEKMAFDPGVKIQIDAFQDGKSHKRPTRKAKRKNRGDDLTDEDSNVSAGKKQKSVKELDLHVVFIGTTDEVYSRGGAKCPTPSEWESMFYEHKSIRPIKITSNDTPASIRARIVGAFCGSDKLFGTDSTLVENFTYLWRQGYGSGRHSKVRPVKTSQNPDFEDIKTLREAGTNTATRRFPNRVYIALAEGSPNILPPASDKSDNEEPENEEDNPRSGTPLDDPAPTVDTKEVPGCNTENNGEQREYLFSKMQEVWSLMKNMTAPSDNKPWWPLGPSAPYEEIIPLANCVLGRLAKYDRSKDACHFEPIAEEVIKPDDLFQSLTFLVAYADTVGSDSVPEDENFFAVFNLGEHGLFLIIKALFGIYLGLRTHNITLPIALYNSVVDQLNNIGHALHTLLQEFRKRVARQFYARPGFSNFFNTMDNFEFLRDLPAAVRTDRYLFLVMDPTTYPGQAETAGLFERVLKFDFGSSTNPKEMDTSAMRTGVYGLHGLLYLCSRFLDQPPVLPDDERRKDMYDNFLPILGNFLAAVSHKIRGTSKASGKQKESYRASPGRVSPRPESIHTLSSGSEDEGDTPSGAHRFHFREEPFPSRKASPPRSSKKEPPESKPRSQPQRTGFKATRPATGTSGGSPSTGGIAKERIWQHLIDDLESEYLCYPGHARAFYQNLWMKFAWYPRLQSEPDLRWNDLSQRTDYEIFKAAIWVFHSDKLPPHLRTDDMEKLANEITRLLVKCKELNHTEDQEGSINNTDNTHVFLLHAEVIVREASLVAESIPHAEEFAVERALRRLIRVYHILSNLDDRLIAPNELQELMQTVIDMALPLSDFLRNPPPPPKAHTRLIYTGQPGRPCYQLDLQRLVDLHDLGCTWKSIAQAVGVDRKTIYNHLSAAGLSHERPTYSVITDEELDEIVAEISLLHPMAGSVIMAGHLEAQGWRIPLLRVQHSLQRVDAIGVFVRWNGCIKRRIYKVRGVNALWHHDGNEKLRPWGFYIHGSTQNVRIERAWRDVRKDTIEAFRKVFTYLTEVHLLDMEDSLHRICLYIVYQPRIQASLNRTMASWNNHRMRTAQNQTPLALYELSRETAINRGYWTGDPGDNITMASDPDYGQEDGDLPPLDELPTDPQHPEYTDYTSLAEEKANGVFVNNNTEIAEGIEFFESREFDTGREDGNWGIDVYCEAVMLMEQHVNSL
ncbi:hypothetical protein PQX77_001537 [Marasmius sp. AFHP31]|nr:hypothetical protein PQX77_001537 [Marasmius sp. AFHP31]